MFGFAFYDIDTTSCSSLYFAKWGIKTLLCDMYGFPCINNLNMNGTKP